MTRLPIVFLPGAKDDLHAAYLHYEAEGEGLGERFLEAVRRQLNRIESNPQLFGVVYNHIRASLVHRFPYVVYYRDTGEHVLVIAIQHGSREWLQWKPRI